MLGAVLFAPGPAMAADCRASAGDPAATIGACLDQAVAGDSIEIGSGFYGARGHGGLESFPLVLKAGVQLRGQGPSKTVLTARGSRVLVGDLADVSLRGVSLITDHSEVINLSASRGASTLTLRDVNAVSKPGASVHRAMAVKLEAAAVNEVLVRIQSSRITAGGGAGLLEMVDVEAVEIDRSVFEGGPNAPGLQGVVLTSLKPAGHRVKLTDSRIEYGKGVALRINNSAYQPAAYRIDLAGLDTGAAGVQAYGRSTEEPLGPSLPGALMSGSLWLRASAVGPVAVRGLDLHIEDIGQVTIASAMPPTAYELPRF